MSFAVKFWGVRGSVACPSASHIGYGGNTSCIEVILDDHVLLLDAGTGIRSVGIELSKRNIKRADLLLSHTHWDHINGFPFFLPAFIKGNRFDIYAGHISQVDGGLQRVFRDQMAQPFFPVPLQAMQGDLVFNDFKAGEDFWLSKAHIQTTNLNHPNGATGYRVNYKGKSMCYITDTEHVPGRVDQNILALIEGADLVIYDSTYTEEEFSLKIGWGHSTWEEGVKLCRMANVRMLAVFHHDPSHDDKFMEQLEIEVRSTWDGALIARENMTITLAD